MAQDTSKGFLWSIAYWLGFWLSAWFTVALEVSLPMAFGYLDYGIWFFLAQIALLWIASFCLIKSALNNLLNHSFSHYLISSLILVTFYLLFAVSIPETIFWQIGSIAYTYSFVTFILLIAAHQHGLRLGMDLPPRKDWIVWGLFIFIVLIALVLVIFIIRVNTFIAWFDSIFNGKRLYLVWVIFFTFILILYRKGLHYPFFNFIVSAITVFLCVGSGPQFVLLTNAYLFIALASFLYLKRKIHFPSLLLFGISLFFSIIVMLLPGTKNRVRITTGNQNSELELISQGIQSISNNLFIEEFRWLIYLFIFLFAFTFSNSLNKTKSQISVVLSTFFHSLFIVVIIVSVVTCVIIFQSTGGYFPPRLLHNFTSLIIFSSFIYGLFCGIMFGQDKIPATISSTIALISILILFTLSPNLKAAILDIYSSEPLKFRAYKIESFKRINNCESDTCQIPYRKFSLKTISDQHFIFPIDKGFVVSHKLFVSRYFGKEYIFYDPATLPDDLKN